MPVLTEPAIAAGRLSSHDQPSIAVDDELRLRPWDDRDAATVLGVYGDSSIQRWHSRSLMNEQEARELLAHWRRGWTEETGASWAVVGPDDGVLGRIALCAVNLHEATAGIAYWTVPAARGRGIAPRAVRAASGWSTETIGFHRLELRHSVANAASCRVAQKAGFRAEGKLTSAALHPDGWHDMHVHALIAEAGRDPAGSHR